MGFFANAQKPFTPKKEKSYSWHFKQPSEIKELLVILKHST